MKEVTCQLLKSLRKFVHILFSWALIVRVLQKSETPTQHHQHPALGRSGA